MSKQWEYKAIDLVSLSLVLEERLLDSMGAVGWELVSVNACTAYMKREKKAAEPQEPAFPTINDPWAAKAVEQVVAQAEVMQ